MSDRKLMFVHEEGFLRKNYELTLDLPYDKIVEISQKGKHELDFTDVKDKKYVFEKIRNTYSKPAIYPYLM